MNMSNFELREFLIREIEEAEDEDLGALLSQLTGIGVIYNYETLRWETPTCDNT